MSNETFNCWYKDVCQHTCSDACIRYTSMKFLVDNSNIPTNRQFPQILNAPESDYDAFCVLADIKDNIVNFVDNGNSLYITSKSTGNGKTSWSIKLLLKYFDSIWSGNGFNVRALFVHVPTFLLKCKDFKNVDEEFDALRKLLPVVDLVVWDDIASTDISSYDYSQLLMYIDSRVSNKLSNIYTGNLVTRQSLRNALGDKLTSRIWSDNTEIVVFKGGDKR